MNLINKVQNFITSLSEKQFIKYAYIFIGLMFFIFGFIIYRHFSKISYLKKELQKINYLRREAQTILTKDVQVKKQKAIVDEILDESKSFKLLGYFDSVTNKLGIDKNIKEGSKTTSESSLENLRTKGYKEVRVNASFVDLNMKQLVDLLDEFEKNERIYTKSLEIIKSSKGPTIDVDIIIATLQPETEEVTE